MKFILFTTAILLSLSLFRFTTTPCAGDDNIKDFTVEEIENAIGLARQYLLEKQNTRTGDPNFGSWIEPGDPEGVSGRLDARFRTGQTAHVVYALMESGLSPQNKNVRIALDWLVAGQKKSALLRKKYVTAFKRIRTMKKTGDIYKQLCAMEEKACDQTYNIAFRALAFSTAARKGADKYLEPLKQDVKWLFSCSIDGAYGYTCTGKKLALAKARKRASTITVDDIRKLSELYVDASNSQYGLYGVWSGRLAGLDIPDEYWKKVSIYWRNIQNNDGGWGYTVPPRPETNFSRRQSHPSMTAAALASLYVSLDANGNTGIEKHLSKGFEWFEKNFAGSMDPETSSAPPGEDRDAPSYNLNYYYLYGVERVALACGRRTFGGVNWYKLGVEYILSRQYTSGKRWKGSWTGRWVDGFRLGATAYATLFLARGLHPVLFNKLEYKGDWNACPRDMANLTRWLGKELEREINWRVVSIENDPDRWHDSPILYITGTRPPEFTETQQKKLRLYALQGGTIFSCPAGPDAGFSTAMKKLYREIFPECRWMKARETHPVYTVHYKLNKSLQIEVAFNGIRPLAIHTRSTLPLSWQKDRHDYRTGDFMFGINLHRFVTDEAPLLKRGEHSWPKNSEVRKASAIRVTRVKHRENSDPEPLALEAFRRRMADRYGIPVEILDPVNVSELSDSKAQLAFMTGTGEFRLTGSQADSLKKFVVEGGTVLVDPAGGAGIFLESVRRRLQACFEGKRFEKLDTGHEVLAIKGMEIRTVGRRKKTAGKCSPEISAIVINSRAAVFLSPVDLTAGLVGYQSYGIKGYAPKDAFRICRNVALYASGKPVTLNK